MGELAKHIHIPCMVTRVGGATCAQLLGLRAKQGEEPHDLPKPGEPGAAR